MFVFAVELLFALPLLFTLATFVAFPSFTERSHQL